MTKHTENPLIIKVHLYSNFANIAGNLEEYGKYTALIDSVPAIGK